MIMNIEEQIYSKEELKKINELRIKNKVDKINKINQEQREKERKEWRERVNSKPKVLNIGVRVREEFKKMPTKELLAHYRDIRYSFNWNWDEGDDYRHNLEILELQTELSQREHIPRKDERTAKINRQRLAKKHKGGRRGHKKK